jgi:hypothetical protein
VVNTFTTKVLIVMLYFRILVSNLTFSFQFEPPFIFPQGGKVKPLLPPWGKAGKGVTDYKRGFELPAKTTSDTCNNQKVSAF